MLKLRITFAAILLAGLVVNVLARDDSRNRPNGNRPPEGNDRSPGRSGDGRGFSMYRDRFTSASAEAFRNFMQNELKHVPLLQTHLDDLSEIQKQRFELQRERNQVADDRNLSPDAALRNFHVLLRREDEVNARQKALYGRVVRDAPAIQDQISKRRQQIEQTLAASAQVPDFEEGETPTPEQLERRNQRRLLRMYDYFHGRIGDMRESPDRVDLLNRFFRGFPSTEDASEGKMVEQARRRLDEIQKEHDGLRRKLDHLDAEMRELRQLVRGREGRGGNRNDTETTAPRRPGNRPQTNPPL